MKNKEVITQDWGLIDYREAWNRQEEIFAATINLKKELRYRKQLLPVGFADENIKTTTSSYLIFCQHPHVFTLGRSGDVNHLLLDETALRQKNATFYHINRGGDITYHGPGQLLCYPIIDLDHFITDIHLFFRLLEDAVIATLADYGLLAGRYPGYTGVWFDAESDHARKIAALGIRCSNWVTMHGLSLNVDPDLSYFDAIVPCGIKDKAVTSMALELGYAVDLMEAQRRLSFHIERLFSMKIISPLNYPK